MGKQSFMAKVADMVLRFSTSCADGFAEGEDALHGFGVPDTLCADVIDVRVENADHISEPTDGVARFDADSHGQDTPTPFRWSVVTSEDRETITVIYDEGTTPFRAAQAVIMSPNSVRIITEPYESTNTAFAYIFPILNLTISRLLLSRGGFLIHCSVARDESGRGFLFTAPSGTGKSTMARIWQQCGASIVNDDMIAIRIDGEGTSVAHNIPMPYYSQRPQSVPLSGIFLISQSPVNVLSEQRGALAVARVASNVIQQPATRESVMGIMNAVSRCAGGVRVFALGFKPDADVVHLVRKQFTAEAR